MKARGCLIIAAWAVLFALAPGALASTNLHPRHIEYRRPTDRGFVFLGEQDGYELSLNFEDPNIVVLYAETFDDATQAGASTAYGAHFSGLLDGGTVRARFGRIGSIALRFVPDGKTHVRALPKNCQGQPSREEGGRFVGRIALRGEGEYFHDSAARVGGSVRRAFRLRCRVKHQSEGPPSTSLRAAVAPIIEFSTSGGEGGGSLALLEASDREGHRSIGLRAAHREGATPGAEVQAAAFEYQGTMPVGRNAWTPKSAAGRLVTSLPGELPPTATLTPEAPFSGEGAYVADSKTSHIWTGDLTVQFPGLLQPLAGQRFFSSLCVASSLRVRYGCDFVPPNWEAAE